MSNALYNEWGEPMPPGRALHILFYLDDRRFMCDYGTRKLQEALAGGLIDIHVDVQLRPLGVKLTEELLSKYHEVWFFLRTHGPGEPLAPEEVKELYKWMNGGGGVLIMGDHLQEADGVGAPVGICVPRARDLRLWDDGPGTDDSISFDTTEYTLAGASVPPIRLERDAVPQRLLLPAQGAPHPIFRDSAGRWLDRFADHRHEGRVQVEKLNRFPPLDVGPEWPPMNQAEVPTIIACSVNWRRGVTHDLMAQWDGHRFKSGVDTRYGRIIADSSFHHYVDDNLAAIAAAGGENWRKICEIFRNQAAWLAPPAVRDAYTTRAVEWVRAQPCFQEDPNTEDWTLVVMTLLAQALPAAWLHEYHDEILAILEVRPQVASVQAELPVHVLAAIVEQDLAGLLTTYNRPPAELRRKLLGAAIDSYAEVRKFGLVEKQTLEKSIF